MTHIPTGIVVSCQNEKSQIQNRAAALRVLQARLLVVRQAEQRAEMDALKGEGSSWGNQMRSYVLHPYQMVKDLRTEQETGNTAGGARRRHRRLHRGRHPVAPSAGDRRPAAARADGPGRSEQPSLGLLDRGRRARLTCERAGVGGASGAGSRGTS